MILNFHGLGQPPHAVEAGERPYWLSTSAVETVLDAFAERRIPFRVTFDDGNATDFELALPILAARSLAAEFFVCSDRIDRPGYLTAEQVRTLAHTPGFGIGSHGRVHTSWRAADDACLTGELRGSKACLEAVIGKPVESAGIPFGAYDRRVLQHLRRAGYARIFSSDGGPRLRRSGVMPRWTLRSDRSLAEQIERIIASASPVSRCRQEAKVSLKSWF